MQAFIFQFCHSFRTWGRAKHEAYTQTGKISIAVMTDKTVSTFWGLLRHSHPSIADPHSGEMIFITFRYMHTTYTVHSHFENV